MYAMSKNVIGLVALMAALASLGLAQTTKGGVDEIGTDQAHMHRVDDLEWCGRCSTSHSAGKLKPSEFDPHCPGCKSPRKKVLRLKFKPPQVFDPIPYNAVRNSNGN